MPSIRVGVGGWDFEPWRTTFFPPDLPKSRALEYASRRLTMIEVNGTFYRTQTPETFRKWHDATPDGFVFALKAQRGASFRRDPVEAGPAIRRFLESGITELGPKLGPILWQLPPTRKFDPENLPRFLEQLPPDQDGLPLRHVLEAEDPSFAAAEPIAMLRHHGVARVIVDRDGHALLGDLTAPFVYLRLERNTSDAPDGYPADALAAWADRLRHWSIGKAVTDIPRAGPAPARGARDCYALCISGEKAYAPRAAMALQRQLGLTPDVASAGDG